MLYDRAPGAASQVMVTWRSPPEAMTPAGGAASTSAARRNMANIKLMASFNLDTGKFPYPFLNNIRPSKDIVFCNKTPDSRKNHAGMTIFYTFANPLMNIRLRCAGLNCPFLPACNNIGLFQAVGHVRNTVYKVSVIDRVFSELCNHVRNCASTTNYSASSDYWHP